MGKYVSKVDIWDGGLGEFREVNSPVLLRTNRVSLPIVPGLIGELGRMVRRTFVPDYCEQALVGFWEYQLALGMAYANVEKYRGITLVSPIGELARVESLDKSMRVLGVFNPRTNILLRQWWKD
ncbi:MAG: hypothetical protein WCT01_04130 [Candidatus Shapirobacteria bacterium]